VDFLLLLTAWLLVPSLVSSLVVAVVAGRLLVSMQSSGAAPLLAGISSSLKVDFVANTFGEEQEFAGRTSGGLKVGVNFVLSSEFSSSKLSPCKQGVVRAMSTSFVKFLVFVGAREMAPTLNNLSSSLIEAGVSGRTVKTSGRCKKENDFCKRSERLAETSSRFARDTDF